MEEQMRQDFKAMKEELLFIRKFLFENPELGDEEVKAQEKLVAFLKKYGFTVETNLVGRKTSFMASYQGTKQGPTIGIMAEYDALPQIGHGCGHNLIATMGVGAGVLLKNAIDQVGGKVIVYGTPAEETNGAKVPMAEAGLFDHCDVAMMAHPAGVSSKSGESLAMDALEFTYMGKTSHAAASPESGINALDGVILLFNGINALRQHVKDDVKIHGIITEGGQAANIVPDLAVSQFYVRAKDRHYLNDVVEKVKAIATGAAQMTGATLTIKNYELSYDNMITNQTLSNMFTEKLSQLGETKVEETRSGFGSIDMGNVSHIVPSIHPYIGLGDATLIAHTTAFRDQTMTELGTRCLERGVLSLAFTGLECLSNKVLLNEIKREFNAKKSAKQDIV